MKKKYITIEREYGSGGTEIAMRLSEMSGVPCYGRQILEQASQQLDIPIEQLYQHEEKVTNSLLYSLFIMGRVTSGGSNMLTEESKITLTEHAIIGQMADNSPGIFLGHCACEALKERDGVVNVFIHADEDFKRMRIAEEYGISKEKIDSTMKKFDRKRSNYYKANTDRQWRNMDNYDIVLDSSKLGIENCVNLLRAL